MFAWHNGCHRITLQPSRHDVDEGVHKNTHRDSRAGVDDLSIGGQSSPAVEIHHADIPTRMQDATVKERIKTSESKSSLVSDSVSSTRGNVSPSKTVEISEVNLKRRLGLVSGVCFIVGTIIGSGIFISPKGVLLNTESVGLCMVIWVVCGVLAMLTSLAYAELGTMFSKCGADYIYLLETFGGVPAFLFFWVNSVISMPGSTVIKAMTFAEYLTKLLFDDCGTPELIKKLLAAIVILAVGITNSISVRLTARFQVFFTAAKVLALAMVSIGGVVLIGGGTFGALETGFEGSTDSPSAIAFAVYGGMFAYGGWNLPRAILISMPLVTVIYLLVNVSYFAAMTKNEFLSSWAVGVVWAEKVIGPAALIIPLAVACSVYGSANGAVFFNGRTIFAASREEHLPALFSYIHIKTFIPVPSVIMTTILSLLMLIPGDIGSLINFLGFTDWIIYGSVMVCLLVLRYTRKDMHRPVKIPIFIPIVVLLCAIYLVVAPLVRDPKIEFVYAGVFIAASLVLYIPFVHFKLRIPGMDHVTASSQLFLQVAPTDTKDVD
ncbi:hypothetical protein ScPMuIL_000197 [Solemya velum]